jgi:predicted nucleic acid-binding protein
MVVADSSVWVEYFNGGDDPACDELARFLAEGSTRLVVPDLVLFEVLRGFRHERDYRQAHTLLQTLSIEATMGSALAVAAAQHYRALRALGVTVRSAIDVLIAAFCIEHDYLLLHRDRDFDAFEEFRGLRIWRH